MPEIGRFFGVDPVSSEYMSISTYQFAHNSPIWKIEIEGLEGESINLPDIINHEPVVIGGFGNVYMSRDKRAERADMVMNQFNNNFAKRLVSHYAHGNGQSVRISKAQMMQTNPRSVSIYAGAFSDTRNKEAQRFKNELNSLKPGESKTITQTVSGGVKSSGTLGRFTVKFNGTLTKGDNDEKWNFSGTMQFFDEWNFDKKKKGVRSESGELMTKIGREFLIGDGFDIISDPVKVNQNSEESQIDWWNNKNFKRERSELGKNMQKYPIIETILKIIF